jgi:hypothetical protein
MAKSNECRNCFWVARPLGYGAAARARSSKLLATASFGGVLLCLAGCYFGDSIAQRTVSLGFPVADQQTNASLSATNAEVLEALRIIDEVMVREGFVRNQNPLAAEDRAQGLIATYGRYTVLLRDHTLMINFVEFGKRHSSPAVKKVCRQLTEKLGKCFGDKRVREDTGSARMQVSMDLSVAPVESLFAYFALRIIWV